ncbi:MAG: hypothetical protein CML23_00230 [Rhizobiaceae bacterium]|nr:hypothetical protein [Rhizobiaceae bacterium]
MSVTASGTEPDTIGLPATAITAGLDRINAEMARASSAAESDGSKGVPSMSSKSRARPSIAARSMKPKSPFRISPPSIALPATSNFENGFRSWRTKAMP